MPPTCTICRHPKRKAMDEALARGEAFRHIAARFGTSTGSLQRHKPHLLPAVIQAKVREEEAHGLGLVAQVRELAAEARRIGKKAEKEGDLRCTLAAVKQMGDFLDLIAKLTGQYDKETRDRDRGVQRIVFIQQVDRCTRCGAETARDGVTDAIRFTVRGADGQTRELPPRQYRMAGTDRLAKNLTRRHLDASQRATAAAKVNGLKWGRPSEEEKETNLSLKQLGQMFKVSEMSIKGWQSRARTHTRMTRRTVRPQAIPYGVGENSIRSEERRWFCGTQKRTYATTYTLIP